MPQRVWEVAVCGLARRRAITTKGTKYTKENRNKG